MSFPEAQRFPFMDAEGSTPSRVDEHCHDSKPSQHWQGESLSAETSWADMAQQQALLVLQATSIPFLFISV